MTDSPAISTSVFRIPASRFLSRLAGREGFWYIFGVSLLVAVGMVFGIFVDLRIFIIVLMIALIGIPFLIFFLYWSFGMTRVNSVNVLPHKIVFNGGILKISVLRSFPDPGEEQDKEQEEAEEEPEEDWLEYTFVAIAPPVQISGGFSVAVRDKASGCIGEILCPRTAFESDDDCGATFASCRPVEKV